MSLRKKLRALIAAPGLAVLPGAYDALSARIIAREGLSALAGSSRCRSGAPISLDLLVIASWDILLS